MKPYQVGNRFSNNRACAAAGGMGLSLYGSVAGLEPAKTRRLGRAHTLPSHTAPAGAQVAPQRCPILRQGAFNVARAGQPVSSSHDRR